MVTATAEQVARWRQVLAEHPRRWCRRCGQRRCWEQADARAQLAQLATAGLPAGLARP